MSTSAPTEDKAPHAAEAAANAPAIDEEENQSDVLEPEV